MRMHVVQTLPWRRLDFVIRIRRSAGRRRDERPHSVCFEGSDTHPTRRALFELFRDFPGADVRAPAKLGRHGHVKRNPVCATRERMASCRFCLVPPGLTPTSRRLYEAIATRCVPVIVSDRFVVPFSELIGDAALDQLVLRIPEAEVATAPTRIREDTFFLYCRV